MDKAGSNQAAGQLSKKARKKLAKEESEKRMQAEKKKRRLEKALANSAAIISELEKKRQQKQEEQQRLDDEGAAIAEAVALHVLIGEEDCDEPRQLMWNERTSCKSHLDDFVGLEQAPGARRAREGSPLTCASHPHVPHWRLTDCGMAGPFSFSSWERSGDLEALYHREGTSRRGDSETYHHGLVAATQAVRPFESADASPVHGARAPSSINIMFSEASNSMNIYRREF